VSHLLVKWNQKEKTGVGSSVSSLVSFGWTWTWRTGRSLGVQLLLLLFLWMGWIMEGDGISFIFHERANQFERES
jgi:hypothetical protein